MSDATAPLDASYTGVYGKPVWALIEDTLMITPERCSRKIGMNALLSAIRPKTLVWN